MTIKIRGFYPLFEAAVSEAGLGPAAVFGVYWRFWAAYGTAHVSQKRVAGVLRIDDRTVRNHIAVLLEKKLLRDLTPSLRGAPHTYVPTERIQMIVTAEIDGKEAPETLPENISGVLEEARKYFPEAPENISDLRESIKEKEKETTGACSFCHAPIFAGEEEPERTEVNGRSALRCGTCQILGVTTPKPATEAPIKRTSAEHARRIVQAMEAYERTRREGGELRGLIVEYPEDVRSVLERFCELTKISPPAFKSNAGKYWLTSARSLRSACGEFGLDVLALVVTEHRSRTAKTGTPPYSIDSPNSLVNPVRGKAGQLRSSVEDDADYWENVVT